MSSEIPIDSDPPKGRALLSRCDKVLCREHGEGQLGKTGRKVGSEGCGLSGTLEVWIFRGLGIAHLNLRVP